MTRYFNYYAKRSISKAPQSVRKGANINAPIDGMLYTILHEYLASNEFDDIDPEVVKLLIDKGADLSAKSNDGKTPLMFACG